MKIFKLFFRKEENLIQILNSLQRRRQEHQNEIMILDEEIKQIKIKINNV